MVILPGKGKIQKIKTVKNRTREVPTVLSSIQNVAIEEDTSLKNFKEVKVNDRVITVVKNRKSKRWRYIFVKNFIDFLEGIFERIEVCKEVSSTGNGKEEI